MTDITEIFDRFLVKINDYSLSLLEKTENEVTEILTDYYRSAIAHFPQCSKNLEPIQDTTLLEDNLTPLEKEIVVGLMIIEYLKPIIARDEVLKQVLSDSDFRVNSQANHMNQLRGLYNTVKQEMSVNKVQYSYIKGGLYND